MAKEIERKFLVKGDAWRALAKGTTYRQGYLNSAKERTVRVRTAEDKAFLTIKGLTLGATRAEYEYEIPFDEGKAMLDALAEKPLIEKKRYKIPCRRPDVGNRRVPRRQRRIDRCRGGAQERRPSLRQARMAGRRSYRRYPVLQRKSHQKTIHALAVNRHAGRAVRDL